MRKILFSLSLIAAFFVYLVFKRANLGTTLATAPNAGTAPNPAPATPSAPAATSTPSQPSPALANQGQPAASQGQYRDGSYVGPVTDAWYGNVQVKAVVKNGALADVRFLQYPNTHSYSVYVNSQAMPYLTQEAVQAQNANVDVVSGATQTSLAFIQSLQSALAQAKN
ncbi:FMN-binding protein [Patescibacteria group bacterium]|nr:FMN-binding protein [Patescibacteria group bacterium]